MKHLSFDEFKELMKSKGETTITTNNGIYQFAGIGEYKVYVQFYFKLKRNYKMGDGGFNIIFDKVITLAEAQCIYASLE